MNHNFMDAYRVNGASVVRNVSSSDLNDLIAAFVRANAEQLVRATAAADNVSSLRAHAALQHCGRASTPLAKRWALNPGDMSLDVRRVAAGIASDGKARVLAGGSTSRRADLRPVLVPPPVWATQAADQVGRADTITGQGGFVPAPAGPRLMVVAFLPDSMMTRSDFDGAAFGAAAGLAERFEHDEPGMHSIDDGVVPEGELTPELDDGQQVLQRWHDVAVQHGNRRAWRNLGDRPRTGLFALLGASCSLSGADSAGPAVPSAKDKRDVCA